MGTIEAVHSGPTNVGIIEVLWEALTTTDPSGSGVLLGKTPDITVQVFGNFSGSASVAIEGSNDGGTTWTKCNDITGSAIAITAAAMALVVESPKLMRPTMSAGDGSADIDVYLVGVAK